MFTSKERMGLEKRKLAYQCRISLLMNWIKVLHNGVLTVVIQDDYYVITAIKETLDKTKIGNLEVGSIVNLIAA